MLSNNIVKETSANPVPGKINVDEDIAQNHIESSPLTSDIHIIRNSTQTLLINKNTSVPVTDGFLTRVWRCLQGSGDKNSGGNISDEEGTELQEILTQGEALRQKAHSLSTPNSEPSVPQAWKGSLLQRCLVGAGLLAGTGVLGGVGYAGYKYYHAGTATSGTPKNSQRSGTASTIQETGGSLEDAFGHHTLYHDDVANRLRHHRRHLSASTPTYNDVQWKDDIKFTLKITNDRVKNMLRDKGALPFNKPITKEKMLYEISMHLYNSENRNIEYTSRTKSLAQTILADSGIYGENEDEILSIQQAESVVRYWVFQNIIGATPEKYLDSKIKMDISKNYTINDIHRLLPVDRLPEVRSFHINKLSKFEKSFLSIMWKEILLEEMPFLVFKDKQTTSIPLNHDDFANLYAGSRFINDIEEKNITTEEIISTGKEIWILAMIEGIHIDQMAYFTTPAILFYSTSTPESKENEKMNDADITEKYLNYKIEMEVRKDFEKKYNLYHSEINKWLSKGRLADSIIENCSHLEPDKFSAKGIKNAAKQLYLSGYIKPCDSAPGSLENEYQKLTTAAANSFYEIDKYFILSAFNALTEYDLEFISSPRTMIHNVKLKINLKAMIAGGHIIDDLPGDIILNNVDLFSVSQDKQERIYALQELRGSQEGYRIIHLDRNLIDYRINNIFHPDLESTYEHIGLFKNFNESFSLLKTALTTESDHIKSLIDTLSHIHRTELFNNLYEKGNDKSDLQAKWNKIKKYIPFYECIEHGIQGNPKKAIPACMLDTISMIPLIGQASILGGKFGLSLVRGCLINTAIGGKQGIRAVGKNILQEVTLPTTMELTSLGKTALMTLDPGFSLLARTVKVSRQYGLKIINSMFQNSKTMTLAKKLDARITKISQETSSAMTTGILPGTKREIPVAIIKAKNNQNIYVAKNPITGEKFGTKYECLKNGILAPVSSMLTNNLIRNTRSDKNIFMRQPIDIGNNIRRVKRADNSNLCSELPSTSGASRTQSVIVLNPFRNNLLQLPSESPQIWAIRLLNLGLSVSKVARKTGIPHTTIKHWPEIQVIMRNRKIEREYSQSMAISFMNEKNSLTNEDLKKISQKTNIPVSTLRSMDEYKLKFAKSRNPLKKEEEEKIKQMITSGYSRQEIQLQTNISYESFILLQKKLRYIAASEKIQNTEKSLLDEISELRKTHSTVQPIKSKSEVIMSHYLSEAKNQLTSYKDSANKIVIGLDDKNNSHIVFNSPQEENNLQKWATDNGINIIKIHDNAEEALVNLVPNIRHIKSSHDIDLDAELLLLKNNIGTKGIFSHKLSKERKSVIQHSSQLREGDEKLKTTYEARKKQFDEARSLLREGKLSIHEIQIKTGLSSSGLRYYHEYKIWKKSNLEITEKVSIHNRMIELYQQGKSAKEISEILNKPLRTVHHKLNIWKKINSTTPNKASIKKEALELRRQGKSAKEISEILNKPLSTIYDWINSVPANLQWEDNSDEDLSEIYYDLDSEDDSGEALPVLDAYPDSEDSSSEDQSEDDYILDWAMPEL
ncbi:helix-turn-helix domain-containing protein [Klebsiella sp. BIGb0407]|uniref:helix-turn-helix domain-containing protein n=1 Tax=Klebsiella sp. BIGb0407 TaxID=2940603 RepID=UPI002167A04B|nr:helix-turn-helix domain-containing protein [Klebsiella sp. BIGb0407]MCS3433123.1 transposase/transcriptional regulator with XRE-family HTH domain [Klebsiella sp. BIGb0407]